MQRSMLLIYLASRVKEKVEADADASREFLRRA